VALLPGEIVLSVRSGSVAELVTFTVPAIAVLLGATTSTAIVSCAAAPSASDLMLHLTVPVDPIAGAIQLDPAGAVRDSNWTFDGKVSVTTVPGAAEGRAFCTVIA
jgi:hypothetical protein